MQRAAPPASMQASADAPITAVAGAWDRTRNASKVWCGMYAGADGRACGSIAKVRRYRARRAGTAS